MKKYLILLLFILPAICFAQSVAINTDGSHADTSAILDVKSNAKGVLIPRMTMAQRNAITTPSTGLMLYQTDNTPGFYYHNGSAWNQLSTGNATNYWSTNNGTDIYNNTGGRVWVGTSAGTGYFTIKAPVNANGGAFFMSETGDATSNYLYAQIYPGGGTSSTRVGSLSGNFGNGFIVGNQSSTGPLILDAAGDRMWITPSGKVGINTASPTSQLEVLNATAGYGITNTDGTVRLSTLVNNLGGAIGTSTNHNLKFFVNGSDQMVITPSGYVGIGGQVPTDRFELYTPDANYGLLHKTSTVTLGTYISSGVGWFGTRTNSPLYLYASTGASFVALLQNGHLGIGTTTAPEKLSVYTPTNNYGLIHTDNNVTVGTYIGGSPVVGGWIGTKSNHPLMFFTNSGTPSMTILQNGNIGIGTTNPTYPLSVSGTIQTKEVRVETGWADYVFDKDYLLPSLDSVERYSVKNKHLPGIPSAEEIQKNGLAVGETTTKMMQKIEELTLYIIDLQKQLDQLKKKLQ